MSANTRPARRFWIALVAVVSSHTLAGEAAAQHPPPQSANKPWATTMAERLTLNAAQRGLLEDFRATSARSTAAGGLSSSQIRAMTLVERMDFWAQRSALALASSQANAASLRRFYGSLTPAQKAQFDAATRNDQPTPSIAADVLESSSPPLPNYRLPARTEADWLIKPTPENISRVYPSAAMEAREAGKAVIRCITDEDGYLKDCIVLSESPKDRGFGNAALEVTGYMRMQPATESGVPVLGTVTIPLNFIPPPPE